MKEFDNPSIRNHLHGAKNPEFSLLAIPVSAFLTEYGGVRPGSLMAVSKRIPPIKRRVSTPDLSSKRISLRMLKLSVFLTTTEHILYKPVPPS